jgi:hypothetical protein
MRLDRRDLKKKNSYPNITDQNNFQQTFIITSKLVFKQTGKYDHPQVGMTITFITRRLLLKLLNGGPTKASCFSSKQIHCSGLAASVDWQFVRPWF